MEPLLFYLALLVAQLIFLFGVLLYLARITANLVSDFFDVPFVATPRRVLSIIFDELKIVPGDVVYELGSGDGRFLLYAASREPEAQYIGIERNPMLLALSRIRQRLHGNLRNVTFQKGNFFATDLTRASKVYAYLLNSVMNRLYPTLLRDFHGRFASRAFRFQQKNPMRVVSLGQRPASHGQHELAIYDFD